MVVQKETELIRHFHCLLRPKISISIFLENGRTKKFSSDNGQRTSDKIIFRRTTDTDNGQPKNGRTTDNGQRTTDCPCNSGLHFYFL
ncbi:hypothetical protein B9Z55_010566 [Caenorhabditis nigoni]|uniref:Uncharacterized protein n=1 Tax=Caenorhabditis nigoni TaxID=1611254 RepID=A0A2G5UGL5_9PELO|nr:hypothetical protein B9Z55_010566 [Caenorhabditis nigoni]